MCECVNTYSRSHRSAEFNGISPIVVEQDEENCTATSAESLRRQVRLHGLGGFLFSNPGNPTGTIVRGQKLSEYCAIARDENCLMLMDEFYSHYCYDEDSDEGRASVEARGFNAFSSAEFVDDVDEDPVVIINGLTKNWRLPGWRVCWVVGPRHAIDVLASVGSFMDGGANQPLQAAAPSLLNIDFVRGEFRNIPSPHSVAARLVTEECEAPCEIAIHGYIHYRTNQLTNSMRLACGFARRR